MFSYYGERASTHAYMTLDGDGGRESRKNTRPRDYEGHCFYEREKPKEERESAAAEKRPTTKEERYELAENASRIVSCQKTRVSSGFRTVVPRRQAFEAPTARRPRRPL